MKTLLRIVESLTMIFSINVVYGAIKLFIKGEFDFIKFMIMLLVGIVPLLFEFIIDYLFIKEDDNTNE